MDLIRPGDIVSMQWVDTEVYGYVERVWIDLNYADVWYEDMNSMEESSLHHLTLITSIFRK